MIKHTNLSFCVCKARNPLDVLFGGGRLFPFCWRLTFCLVTTHTASYHGAQHALQMQNVWRFIAKALQCSTVLLHINTTSKRGVVQIRGKQYFCAVCATSAKLPQSPVTIDKLTTPLAVHGTRIRVLCFIHVQIGVQSCMVRPWSDRSVLVPRQLKEVQLLLTLMKAVMSRDECITTHTLN